MACINSINHQKHGWFTITNIRTTIYIQWLLPKRARLSEWKSDKSDTWKGKLLKTSSMPSWKTKDTNSFPHRFPSVRHLLLPVFCFWPPYSQTFCRKLWHISYSYPKNNPNYSMIKDLIRRSPRYPKTIHYRFPKCWIFHWENHKSSSANPRSRCLIIFL